MVNIMLSMPGQLYQDSITEALKRAGNFRVLTEGGERAEIALLGVSVRQGYTLKERQALINAIKAASPDCRIVLFVDELVSSEQTEGIKQLKQARVIDGFLYASVTMDYLVATLESI